MNKNKHTPGPWKIVDSLEGVDDTFRIKSENKSVAIITGTIANAALIAAAPELYEMIDKINTAFYTRTSRKEWLELMEKTKPLLQKARGE